MTVTESHEMYVLYRQIVKSDKPFVYLRMTGVYNIFDSETGVNIGLEK